jgi:hypothetical protein
MTAPELTRSSSEVERWLYDLTDSDFERVGGFIQWMLAHDGAPDGRVIVTLAEHLSAVVVPKGATQTWAMTFYVAEGRIIVMLTVYQLHGEQHPARQVDRAKQAMEKARRRNDDPSALWPGK